MKIPGMVIANYRFINYIDEFDLERAEFLLIEEENRKKFENFLSERKIPFSAHAPVFIPETHPDRTGLLSCIVDADGERREKSIDMMLVTLKEAARLGAEYVVVHAQRPENFGGENTAGFDQKQALDSAKRSCEVLSSKSIEYSVPVYIENLFRNRSFYSPESFNNLLESFPEMGFCLDVGHLAVDSRELDFPFDEFVDAVLPSIKAIHLQNANPDYDNGMNRPWKIPVHPSQRKEDGWCDIEGLLGKVLKYNPDCTVNFESRTNVPEERRMLIEGIEWIKELIPSILDEVMLH
ncbi:MAG TPA: TIM barrel protein [bacterium]|nr:TIM barrel protein [bacterium]